MSKELGRKIRTIRLKRNLSQSEMADILGYSGKGMISRLENDSADMSYDKLMLLLTKFNDDFTEDEKELIPFAKNDLCLQTKRLQIKRIGFKELDDLISIKISKSQREFVTENAIAIAETYIAEKDGTRTECFIAYDNKKPVGFVSIALGSIDAKEKKEWMKESYFLWRIAVDSIYQCKGYYGEILDAIIDWCSFMPLGKSNKIYTSCNKNNIKTINLYKSRGFKKTRKIIDGKIILVRNIKEICDE